MSSPPKADANAKRSFEKLRAQAELGYENKRRAPLHALAERFQFLLRLRLVHPSIQFGCRPMRCAGMRGAVRVAPLGRERR